MRQIEVETTSGDVLMTGLQGRPLLMVDRVGDGRVALLASDHAWLWDRGFEGGGPQAELLRRLAHWSMKEPDLEEEALLATVTANGLLVTRRSLTDEAVSALEVTTPSGEIITVTLVEVAAGRYEGIISNDELGLYRLRSDGLEVVAALGPVAPREFVQTIASAETLRPTLAQTGGGVMLISQGFPKLRDVQSGRPAHGLGWIGLVARDAFVVQGVQIKPLLPSWIYLLLAAAALVGGWLREGRRFS
jgi:hypothetical protein